MKKIFWTGILGFIFLLLYMLYKADISIMPVSIQYRDHVMKSPVYLVSYADGNEVFYKNQHALTVSAQNKGFDFFFNYRRQHLDKNFMEKYKDILEIKSGAGLWLWKPYIILKTLEQAPEGAIVIYTDTGFLYVRPVDELINLVQQGPEIILMNLDNYYNSGTLKDWVPAKIWAEWGFEKLPPHKRPKFFEAGLITVRNTKKARQFMKEWLQICANRKYAFLKYDRQADGIKGFTYDQSLLSYIAYHHPETVRILPKSDFKKYTLFHHRHPGNNKPLLPFQVLPFKQIREWIEPRFPNLFLKIGF